MKKIFFALGTINTIETAGNDNGQALLEAALRVMELDDRLSAFKPDSEISRINQAAGKRSVPVHPDTMLIIKTAIKYAEFSDGAFDITIRPLVELWGAGSKLNLLPSPAKIEQARQLVNFRDILLDEQACSVMLKRQDQALDLGGIAKGYAADEARRILLAHGVYEALINLGGTVEIIGAARTVGIQHPQLPTGTPMGRVSISDQAVVTSGTYEKFFVKDGIRYHHLLDPRTGLPADSGLCSVTIIGDSAMVLDALTTAALVLGLEAGSALAASCGLQAIFVNDEQGVFAAQGLKDHFSLINMSVRK